MKSVEDMIYNKYRKYEMVYIRISWAYLLFASFVYFVKNIFFVKPSLLTDPAQKTTLFLSMAVCAVLFLENLIKHQLFKSEILENKLTFLSEKILTLFLLSFAIIYSNIGSWLLIMILIPIIITCLIRGLKSGIFLFVCSIVMHFSIYLAKSLPELFNGKIQPINLYNNLVTYGIYYVMFLLFVILMAMIYKDGIEHDIENRSLMEQLEEKYDQLQEAQSEIKYQYDELMSTNDKLEMSNRKLSESIAEFYTLQQISQAIGSILDVKELLRYLNDIILGVMGVSYSTIILYDEKTNRLKVQTSNIKNTGGLAAMKDNINTGILLNVLNNNESILENNVDPVLHAFTQGRDIHSLICVPLNTNTRKFGLVLVEHTYADAFDDGNLRLLNIIAKQVGIAMENAELYNKMTELARKDGLTGIHNRQYFQERLEVEFNNAILENYSLSLAIFDIDHFKKFNDTYGHMFGDKVLITLVETVFSTLRKNDIMARFGGEEFIILFPRTSLQEAYKKVEDLREKISKMKISDHPVTASITVSFGVSAFNECALTEKELVKTADDALYRAKAAGRNCVRMACPLTAPLIFDLE